MSLRIVERFQAVVMVVRGRTTRHLSLPVCTSCRLANVLTGSHKKATVGFKQCDRVYLAVGLRRQRFYTWKPISCLEQSDLAEKLLSSPLVRLCPTQSDPVRTRQTAILTGHQISYSPTISTTRDESAQYRWTSCVHHVHDEH